MKKLIIYLLCCVVLVSMVGCGGKTAPPPTESPPTTVSETIMTETPTETTPPKTAVEPTEKEKEPPPTESKDQATKPTTTAANKIEQGVGRKEGSLSEDKQTLNQTVKTPQTAKFEPKQPKIRRPGTGCITEINDHLFEGRYSPKNAYGKRTPKNVYAKTREECEEKLAELISQMNAEIAAEKERIKSEQTA